MIIELDALGSVPAGTFVAASGWEPKPEGWCRDDVCVPGAAGFDGGDTVDVRSAADRLGMAIVVDEEHGLAAVGPASFSGSTLLSAVAADPPLVDRAGNEFRLSSLRGRKVILSAWSSY